MIKKRYIVATIITMLIFSLSILSVIYCSTPSYKKMIPPDAKVINEYRWGTWFPPDYCWYLKMEISYKSFLSYKEKMGFVLLPKEKYNIFDLGGFDNHTEPWWNPKNEPNQVYYNPSMKGSQKAFMKCENGFLYYKESAGL